MQDTSERENSKPLALITGASAGIGEAFATLYAEKGYDLILVARREAKLTSLATTLSEAYGARCETIALDLSKPDAATTVVGKLAERKLSVDVLINNAGYGLPGTFHGTNWQEQRDFLQLMFNTPVELCHHLLPSMRAKGFGRIINVASLAGLVPGSTGHTLYSGVKSGLIKFSESLNAENQGTGVHASALCPGMTYSEFHDVNGQRDRVSELPDYMWKSAKEVAEAGYKYVEANNAVCVPGAVNKSIAAFAQILPGDWARALMRKQSSKFRKVDDH